jgi:hypothetical protein
VQQFCKPSTNFSSFVGVLCVVCRGLTAKSFNFGVILMRKRYEKRAKRPIGPMQLERTVETLPSFERVLMRFRFQTDFRVDGHACFVWLKQQPEVVKLMSSGTPATRKTNMNQDCRNLDAALAQMSFQQLAQLRLRWLMHEALH